MSKRFKYLNKKDRYQHQPWYIKLWRNRWELLVPYWAIREYTLSKDPEEGRFSWKCCWSIACGYADAKKGHVYGWNEVRDEVESYPPDKT